MLAAQRYYFAALAVILVFLSCSFFYFRDVQPLGVHKKFADAPERVHDQVPEDRPKPSLRDTITSLFEEIKHDPTNLRYREPSGKWYSANNSFWQKPLGKRVLIVDIDTRVPNGDNQILNPVLLDYEHLEPSGGGLVSNAIINHYMYAMIHGYDYKYYQAQHIPDHYDTWIMPHVFRELIPDYDFVVAMDADAIVSHLEVPLEWMFNRWGIHPHLTSMALPLDTEEMRGNISISRDSKYNRVLNTGFVVAQNSALTIELLEAWRDCTTETRYPGCAQWKQEWSHEQRAFSEYIRYDFNRTPETIVPIPCDDAVGYPDFRSINAGYNSDLSDCNGNFIRHYTIGKEKVKNAGAYTLVQSLSDVIQKSLLREKNTLWYKEPEKGWLGDLKSLVNSNAEPSAVPEGPGAEEGAPEGVSRADVEAAQSEIRKEVKEGLDRSERPKEEEVPPVVLDGM